MEKKKISRETLWPNGLSTILDYPEAKRIFVKTSRSAGKSTTWTRVMPLEIMALSPERNIAVLGKTTSWHINNTMNDLEKNISSMETEFDIKGTANLFKFSRDKNAPRVYYTPTKQMIAFLGVNSPDNAKGISPKKGYFDTIIWEESLSIDENNSVEETMDNYKSIRTSLFKNIPDGALTREFFFFNCETTNHPIIWEHLEKLPEREPKYEKKLRETGCIHHYDKDSKTLYLTLGWRSNQFLGEVERQQFLDEEIISPYWAESFSYGFSVEATGDLFKKYLDKITYLDTLPDSKDISVFDFGLDYGVDNDAMTCYLTGTYNDNPMENLVVLWEYYHSNKNLAIPKLEDEMLEEIVEGIKKVGERYPFIKAHNIKLNIDAPNKELAIKINQLFSRKGMSWIRAMKVVGKKNWPVINRVNDFWIFRMPKLHVYNGCHNFIKDIPRQEGHQTYGRVDKNTDTFNGVEYSLWNFRHQFKFYKGAD